MTGAEVLKVILSKYVYNSYCVNIAKQKYTIFAGYQFFIPFPCIKICFTSDSFFEFWLSSTDSNPIVSNFKQYCIFTAFVKLKIKDGWYSSYTWRWKPGNLQLSIYIFYDCLRSFAIVKKMVKPHQFTSQLFTLDCLIRF